MPAPLARDFLDPLFPFRAEDLFGTATQEAGEAGGRPLIEIADVRKQPDESLAGGIEKGFSGRVGTDGEP